MDERHASRVWRPYECPIRNEATANESETTDKRDNRVDDSRGGFVLQSKSSEHMLNSRRRSLDLKKNIFKGILKKGASTGELDKRTSSGSLKSTASSASYISTDSAGSAMTNNSMPSDSNASFVIDDEQLDPNVTETYMGEWKNDKRSGYGISERSDGLKYEGEWYANKKYGYGVTTFSNAEKEEGKYKNNVLITSQKKKLFLMRSTKFRERIDAAVNAAQRASKIALQKADIAISRTATARGKAEQADLAAAQARDDSEVAESVAKKYAPDFKQTITSLRMRQKFRERMSKNLESTTNDKLPNTNLGLQPGNKMSNQIPNQINIQHRDQIGNHVPHMLNNLKANDASNDMQVNNNMYADKPIQNATPMQPVGKQQQHNPFQQHQPYQDNKALQQNHSNTSNPSFNHVGLPTNEHNPNEIKSHLPRNNVQTMTDREHNPVGGSNPRNSITAEQSLHRNSLAGLSRRQSGERPYLANIGHQMSIDHFDHYKRPPSRDSSVDRYTRATGKLSNSISSRQPSVDRTSTSRLETPEKNDPAYRLKSASPEPINTTDAQNQNNRNNWPPFEDVIIRKRGLGQDIVPSLNNPKRTESLHIPNQPKPPPIKTIVNQQSLQRKKSLPDVQELPRATTQIPREEVAALGSARREEIRRQLNEKERLRANPLLYLVSPQVKDWISRQQLVLVVLFVNISLAILFFKLLT
ncbi:junctophilin-3 isoform X2 [Cylas formicarius]|uniref:junctophilin-3 isoform X2 n=1 Tax=Cylas formicarius TaxID=197179 RepID=UPI0029586F60|nr:junctophilin-3 isoform X2 [Cylas formicarius]